MAARNPDLHGNVPDKAEAALVLIDVINDLEWEGGEEILPAAMKMAEAIAKLKQRAGQAHIPSIYVNDNFGRWKSDFQSVVDHVLQDGTRGAKMVEGIKPGPDDYFVLKPKHSGFFSTTLATLLEYLEVKTLILCGIQTNICVLFTANEAYMRDFHLIVPPDCSASQRAEDHTYAMTQIEKILKADVRPSADIDFEKLTVNNKTRKQARPPSELRGDGRDA